MSQNAGDCSAGASGFALHVLKTRKTYTTSGDITVAIVGKWLNRVVQEYFNYHAVPGNLYRLAGLRSEICRAWRQSLIRRSQRHRLPWLRFSRIAVRFIPTVRKAHPYPEERFYASHT